nr:MAG TPA: hypothetical protein [Caudoviricetes sp.]
MQEHNREREVMGTGLQLWRPVLVSGIQSSCLTALFTIHAVWMAHQPEHSPQL